MIETQIILIVIGAIIAFCLNGIIGLLYNIYEELQRINSNEQKL